ncbi:hypothetical protein AAFF_G00268760 [Aldrovandia affinis]|uniref:Uncharacterized protein n=1 Tax=Aldrovandia affinis TaxID=143900 RepID=A0AAD7WSP3_9TELE|nr:hypothetical protein AAFF_G00268760 [Aldrovandia affinis]
MATPHSKWFLCVFGHGLPEPWRMWFAASAQESSERFAAYIFSHEWNERRRTKGSPGPTEALRGHLSGCRGVPLSLRALGAKRGEDRDKISALSPLRHAMGRTA